MKPLSRDEYRATVKAAESLALHIEILEKQCPGFNVGGVVTLYQGNRPVGYVDKGKVTMLTSVTPSAEERE